jgi:hypothetical protein
LYHALKAHSKNEFFNFLQGIAFRILNKWEVDPGELGQALVGDDAFVVSYQIAA